MWQLTFHNIFFIIIYNRVLTVELSPPSSKESLRIYGYKVAISGRYTATKNGIPLSYTVLPYKYLFLSNEGPTLETLLYYPYWQYSTNLFIFRFVSLLCLCSTLCFFHISSVVVIISLNFIHVGLLDMFLHLYCPNQGRAEIPILFTVIGWIWLLTLSFHIYYTVQCMWVYLFFYI